MATPTPQQIAEVLHRMHSTAAASEAKAGRHASSAAHDQFAAKWRDAAKGRKS